MKYIFKFNGKKILCEFYNQVIIINEELKQLIIGKNNNNITMVKGFFGKDKIYIKINNKTLEIYTLNTNNIFYPRYIFIFEDERYMINEINEFRKYELSNYIYNKNIKGHIKINDIITTDKNKSKIIGKIININEILKKKKE